VFVYIALNRARAVSRDEPAAAKIHEAEAAVHAEDWGRWLAAAAIAYAISGRGFLGDEDAPWVVEQRHWLEDVHLRALECDGGPASASAGPRSLPPSATHAAS
jgi:hypothetical protein